MTAHAVRHKRLAEGSKEGAMVRIAVGMKPEVFALLKDAAHRRGVPVTEVIREALALYLRCCKGCD